MSTKSDKPESVPRNRGGRLARRARSFKEDLLERITQMRSPSSTRAASPRKISPRGKPDRITNNERRSSMGEDAQGTKTLPEEDVVIRQKEVLNALRYFRGVVENKSFSQLPGSASAVLDAVLSIHNTFQNCFTNEQSSLLVSSNNQVYQSLANLVRWADVVLLQGESAFNKDGVNESVNAVESAVKTLLNIVLDKLKNKEVRDGNSMSNIVHFQNGLPATKSDACGFISNDTSASHPSLQRELEILQSATFPGSTTLGHSVSSDSILGSVQSSSDDLDLPPPKPPLPNGRETFRPNGRFLSTGSVPDMLPPALPPKTRPHLNSCTSRPSYSTGSFICFPTMASCKSRGSGEWFATKVMPGGDWSSPFGHSPSSVSPLSASASSLDSTPNCSTDDLLERVRSNVELPRSSTSSFGYRCQTNQSMVWSEERSVEKVELVRKRFQEMSCLETNPIGSFLSFSGNLQNVESTMTTSSSAALVASCSRSSAGYLSSDRCSPSVDAPPAIPPKRRTTNQRTPSQYDNVPDFTVSDADCSVSSSASTKSSQQSIVTSSDSHLFVATCRSSSSTSGISDCEPLPPPLPLKKKHVMAYMQMFGCMDSNTSTSYMHSYQFVHREVSLTHDQTAVSVGQTSSSEDSVFLGSTNGGYELPRLCDGTSIAAPPALPPKKGKVSNPYPVNYHSVSSATSFNENEYDQSGLCDGIVKSPLSSHKEITGGNPVEAVDNRAQTLKVVPSDSHSETPSSDSHCGELQILDELDARPFLIYKKEEDDCPDIRGGSVSALVVHATFASKNEIIYQDAFMTTYRTFILPIDLVNKLLYRYDKFGHATDVPRQRVARSAFSLLVRVVGDFSVRDIDADILKVLMDFVFKLLCNGELTLARALRKKVLEKWEAKSHAVQGSLAPLSSKGVSTKQGSLLDFKSEQLAEQMTLLDADLFQKIEIAEVLIWSLLQKEESSPNLTTFTEHFNKMSYWARSRILEREDAKDREHYVIKFIKIMKHLRKINNFNSYLAILSALDSAPIRRLEWQRHITEGLKEYCELIDSSSSFRAYRQALAESEPPCIPYIGLILQDLTFVHIGNGDFLPDGNVNFSKRWQQFNILDVMRRFRKCQYNFKRSERIIAFFNNFDDHLCEEAMWQISEAIKPRSSRRKVDQMVQ